MDILLSKFVNKYIDKLNEKNLQDLYDFLNLEDEYIYNFYQSKDGEKKMKITKFLIYLKILKFNGGEGGIRTHERVARCWFSRPVLSTAQPPLQRKLTKLILLLIKNNNKVLLSTNTSLNKIFMIIKKMAKFLTKFILLLTFLLSINFSQSRADNFNNWLSEFKIKASNEGISQKTLNEALMDVKFLPKVIEYDRYQPEFYEDTFTYIKKGHQRKK